MTRRIAVIAENELPHVEVVRLRPGDTLVLHTEGGLSDQEFDEIVTHVKDKFPDNELMIVEGGMRLAVLRREGD